MEVLSSGDDAVAFDVVDGAVAVALAIAGDCYCATNPSSDAAIVAAAEDASVARADGFAEDVNDADLTKHHPVPGASDRPLDPRISA